MKYEFPTKLVETKRLILRNFLDSDSVGCFAFLSDRETCYNDGGYEPFTEMDEEYAVLMERFLRQTSRYMLVSRLDSSVMGTVNILPTEEENVWEIGYVVSPRFRRMGYAAEAITAVCEVLFRDAGAAAIIAGAIESNEPSINMLNKLGFVFAERRGKAFLHPIHGEVDLLYYRKEKGVVL